ncbi:MAG: GTPase [Crenarchaeota archaeon]|nr:GTPase [Thermoproteota archaeon]
MQKIRIEPGKLLRVEGPAAIRVIDGEVYVLGVTYGADSRFTVLRARKVVVKPLKESTLEITLGPDGSVEEARTEEEVIDIWEDATSKIDLEGVTVILGAMDVGKTTMTVMIANKASRAGHRVGIIDADLGQNDLGPPATVDAAVLEPGMYITHLRMLKPVKAMFLKTTSVERVWPEVVDAVKKLVDYLMNVENTRTVVINTDGWVSTDKAVEYKLKLVEVLQPRNIIVIRRGDEVDQLVKNLREKYPSNPPSIVELPAPPAARIRTKEDRRIHREMGYGKYLTPPRDITLDLRKTPIVNFPICSGMPANQDLLNLIRRFIRHPIIYCELAEGFMIAISSQQEKKDVEVLNVPGGGKIVLLPNGWERGLLVGLEDRDNFLLALGRIKKIYYNNCKIVITVSRNFTDISKIDHLRLGMIRLNEQYEEVEKVNYIGRIEALMRKRSSEQQQ